jgi:hypothetical protein
MPDSTTPGPVLPAGVEKIQFHYEKSNLFRVIHVDGAIGGLTPTLDLFISLYNQRGPIPKLIVQRVLPNGQLGEEVMEERSQKEGLFREVEVGLVMNLNVAKALHIWLTDKIELADKTQQKIQAEQQQSEQKIQ